MKLDILKNFAKLRKHLSCSLFFNNVAALRLTTTQVFSRIFCKMFVRNTSGRLLLINSPFFFSCSDLLPPRMKKILRNLKTVSGIKWERLNEKVQINMSTIFNNKSFPENLKTLTSSNYPTIQYFFWNLTHVFCLSMSTKVCVGLFFYFIQILSYLQKLKITWFLHNRFLHFY